MRHEYEVKDYEVLKLENVSKSYDENLILRDINLTVKDIVRKNNVNTGQIIGLLGPSGRGKTQLFKIIAGMIKPTTGTVIVNGKPVEEGDVGVVAQHYPLFEFMKVRENLEMGLLKSKLSKKDKEDKIKMFLEKFGLLAKIDAWPSELSGGQRQRIAIIQQILCSENFLLMDEPFSGLDVNMIREVQDVIVEIANLNELNTIIIISHDITNTLAIATNAWIMGYEHDAENKPIAGSTIKYVEDLAAAGLAWNYPQIFEDPEFQKLVNGIKNVFKTL